jgi:hypothetical protein
MSCANDFGGGAGAAAAGSAAGMRIESAALTI